MISQIVNTLIFWFIWFIADIHFQFYIDCKLLYIIFLHRMDCFFFLNNPTHVRHCLSSCISLILALLSFLFTASVHLSGGSLESVVSQDGCLPEDVVRRFGWDLVKGLKHIHESGIIFSDLTPAKVCIHIHTYVGLTV